MPDTATPDPSPPAAVAAEPPHGLAALKKMSTTAGLGSGDYAAVSPLAVAAVVVGLLGLLAFLTEFLLIVCAAAVALGVAGLVQVRRSNGTLTGRGLAWAGLALGLGAGAVVAGGRVVHESRLRPQRAQVHELIVSFGQALAREDYAAAYRMTDDGFRVRVAEADFKARFDLLTSQGLGKVASAESNGQLFFVDAEGGTGGGADARRAVGGARIRFVAQAEPGTIEVQFSRGDDGRWRIADLPSMFRKQE